MPVTDDEKAEVKLQNETALTAAQDELKALESAKQLLAESKGAAANAFGGNDADKPPKENVELLKKHRKEWEAVWSDKKGN